MGKNSALGRQLALGTFQSRSEGNGQADCEWEKLREPGKSLSNQWKTLAGPAQLPPPPGHEPDLHDGVVRD